MSKTKAKTAEISTGAIEKVFNFINGISASIIYEDPYDYSKGIKGAEVGYIPETVEELASELELEIITGDISAMLAHYKKHSVFYAESHIANLEAEKAIYKKQLNEFQSKLSDERRLKDKAKKQLSELEDKHALYKTEFAKFSLNMEAQNKELREALESIANERSLDPVFTAEQALKEDKQDG